MNINDISIKKNKKVCFYFINKVIFIPKREEIIKVINKHDIWWSLEEFKHFNNSFKNEIQIFRYLYPYVNYKDLCKIIFDYYDDYGNINYNVLLNYISFHIQNIRNITPTEKKNGTTK
jgi:hypothetical protein